MHGSGGALAHSGDARDVSNEPNPHPLEDNQAVHEEEARGRDVYSDIGQDLVKSMHELQPLAGPLDLQPRHFFGKSLHQLSVAQLNALETSCGLVMSRIAEAKQQV